MDIIFTNTFNLDLEPPKPASKFVPKWYTETQSYINQEKKPSLGGETAATIKKCIPVFDAITSGYIISSPVDVWVHRVNDEQHFSWPSQKPIEFHPIDQAPIHPQNKPFPYPKWMNPWSIKTPKGYSTLFVQPFHRESDFTILPGIVDTDMYSPPVNFPFVINDIDFEGLIPAGTPIAQVIPIKRDSWNIKIGNQDDLKNQALISKKLYTKFFDKYKTMFWSKKEYR